VCYWYSPACFKDDEKFGSVVHTVDPYRYDLVLFASLLNRNFATVMWLLLHVVLCCCSNSENKPRVMKQRMCCGKKTEDDMNE